MSLFDDIDLNDIDIEKMNQEPSPRKLIVEFTGRISFPISDDIATIRDVEEKEILSILLRSKEFKAIKINNLFISNS